jgi:ribosomal peptide maturation radical SAM protein 1
MPTDDWPAHFPRSDIVLIVPPFAPTFQPSLACHLLQACARERGFEPVVVYANLLFASIVGITEYNRMLERRILAEAVFRTAAYGPAGAERTDQELEPVLRPGAEAAVPWLDRVGAIIDTVRPAVVGATCSFEQINASIALLSLCKRIHPRITTIIGGANCESEMAEGILSLGGGVDHVASGESEQSFPVFLDQVLNQGVVPDRIIHGSLRRDLESLPLPDYREYFDQFDRYLRGQPHAVPRAVVYESSRGCWWGAKHHCTFCGLNGTTMAFREKSAGRVADDIVSLLQRYPVDRVNMVDNIMPHRYFTTLLPKLAETVPPSATLFYEQKANISYQRAEALRRAQVKIIQPGIESLNSHVLECMDKGVKAYQNIALLRFARSLGITITWNLLAGFPRDRVADYEQLASLLPHVVHLQPPDGLGFVRFDRFSPYFEDPARYGISNLRPKEAYFSAFPPWTDHRKLAYYFDGDYECGAFNCPDVMDAIAEQTVEWCRRWERNPKPMLSVVHVVADQYVLLDTREPAGRPSFDFVDADQVAVLLAGARLADRDRLAWALDRHLLVELDDRLVPLATAHPEVMSRFVNPPHTWAETEPPTPQGRPTLAVY